MDLVLLQLLTLTTITLANPLLIRPVKTNGYFKEIIGEAKLIKYYHKFYFSINLTKIETAIEKSENNGKLFKQKPLDNNASQNLVNQNQINRNLMQQWSEEIKCAKNLLAKLIHQRREKRALASVLGKAIRFITGNLDEDDLSNINTNLKVLFSNQEAQMTKISEFATFANHITNRYSNDLDVINSNLNKTIQILHEVSENADIRHILLSEIRIVEKITQKIKIIERTISLAGQNIPNIEIFNLDELRKVNEYLTLHFPKDNLINLDNAHLFEIIEHSKVTLLLIENAIVMILKIPILQHGIYQYAHVYPIPNIREQVLLPPAKYHLQNGPEEKWTEKCRHLLGFTLCPSDTLHHSSCKLQHVSSCQTAQINNNYKTFTLLENNSVLSSSNVPEDIIENCNGTIRKYEIIGNNILSTYCDLIIQNQLIRKATLNFSVPIEELNETLTFSPQFEVQLRTHHLQDIAKLKEEASRLQHPLTLHPIVHLVQHSITILLFIGAVLLTWCLLRYRAAIQKLICGKRVVVKISRKDLRDLEDSPSNLNEVVQAS